jgi:hypothetical protein
VAISCFAKLSQEMIDKSTARNFCKQGASTPVQQTAADSGDLYAKTCGALP